MPGQRTRLRAHGDIRRLYEDMGADGVEHDEDEATKMRHFYEITASPDACEVTSRELIVSHWPMVLMIAAALLEHEVLTYDGVCSLLEP